MAVATESQSKTGFVKKFLTSNPQGNVKVANEAWAAARMKGTIGSTLFYKTKSEMGLNGNLRAKSKPKTAKATSRPKTPKEPPVQARPCSLRSFFTTIRKATSTR